MAGLIVVACDLVAVREGAPQQGPHASQGSAPPYFDRQHIVMSDTHTAPEMLEGRFAFPWTGLSSRSSASVSRGPVAQAAEQAWKGRKHHLMTAACGAA
jgi:hypothetical protein